MPRTTSRMSIGGAVRHARGAVAGLGLDGVGTTLTAMLWSGTGYAVIVDVVA